MCILPCNNIHVARSGLNLTVMASSYDNPAIGCGQKVSGTDILPHLKVSNLNM